MHPNKSGAYINFSALQRGEKQHAEKKVPFFRRPLMLLISAVLLLIGLIFCVRYCVYLRCHESTDDAFIDAYITQVSPKVASNVVKLHIGDNQHVNAGDLLVELDPGDFDARLADAQAALQMAQARQRAAEYSVAQLQVTARGAVEEASSGVAGAHAAVDTADVQVRASRDRERQAQAAIKVAQAQLNAAEAEARQAKTDVERYQPLHDQGVISRQQWDRVTAAAQTSDARLRAAHAQVEAAQATAASAMAEVQQAQTKARQAEAELAQAKGRFTATKAWDPQLGAGKEQSVSALGAVEQARANLKLAGLQLSYTKIYAPVAGRITRKGVEVGDHVGIGQELMAIVPDNLHVTANFKETQLKLMREGQPVRIRIDAFPDRVFKGHVDSIQRGSGAAFSLMPPENATGNYVKVVQRVPVKIIFDEVPDPAYPLGPGMSVVLEVKVR